MQQPALAPSVAVDAPPALRLVDEPPAAERPIPRLEIPPYDFDAAVALERELGISHTLAQILVRRGLKTAAQARHFLHEPELHDATEFDDIDRALELIERHIASGSRIVVHGDYDVDGVCATAIAVRALRSLGADVGWFLPDRIDDGYGLASRTVDSLAARGVGLLLSVDCGITAIDEVARARQHGLDVVVTDHHAPRADGILPDAPIVHPGLCGYPCPELCGTAVSYKLAQALGAPTAAEDLELVALATVADLMPLQGENRRLVRDGLRAMANTNRPGLRALLTVARADPSDLSAHTLGFRLSPRINAAGRMHRADAALELLLTGDYQRAKEIARELDLANTQRRGVEEQILWEAEAQVRELGERKAYVLAGEGWHPGVIGIVASRIVERYHRPTILVAVDRDSGTGSGRSIPGFDLLGALHSAAPVLDRYGGHRAAAGLTVAAGRVGELRLELERHAAETLAPDQLRPVERVDAIVCGAELGMELADELALLEPCGMGNPAPRLLIPGGRFGEARPMGEGKHVRFCVHSGRGSARAVAFGCDGRLPGDAGAPMDASFRLERNVWNGAVEPRLVLRHAKPCEPAPIEVLGEPARFLAGVLSELDLGLDADLNVASDSASADRRVLDRRGQSPLAVLADAVATGGQVLAVCADVPRRLAGLRARAGGFSLISYEALAREPGLLQRFVHVVALDPPAGARLDALIRLGPRHSYAHLAWGGAELRFAKQMHELEYGLRASLVSLYRSLRQRGRVEGEELELLLRGEGQHGRPARLAGRLIRVLAELDLVSLDPDLPALAIEGSASTALERSAAYRAYSKRHEDGRRYLSSERVGPSG